MSDQLRPMFGEPVSPWRPWFAWLPVRAADGGWLWLRQIERRFIQKHSHLSGGADFWWQYRRAILAAQQGGGERG